MITKNSVLLFVLTLLTTCCLGQVETFYVKPVQTDPAYSPTEDSCAISINNSSQLNKLFLFIGGTGSSSSTDYNALRLQSANLGFDFVNLSYPNDVAAASLANSSDSLVFNKYREEICFGTPVSPDVTVDSLNSISTRALKLIQYLNLTFPSENWGQYLATSTSLDWSKIIVGGHSQGSGHACYLAKYFYVDRVLMFSGPNDYSNTYSNSANWLRQGGITPVGRHFAYLSLNDEIVSFDKQYVNISGLGMLTNDDTTHVDDSFEPYGNSHCLFTTQSPGLVILNHNVPIKLSALNISVWTYMLNSDIITGLDNNVLSTDILLYPNPTDGLIHLSAKLDQDVLRYSVFDQIGRLILSETLNKNNGNHCIDLSELKTGVYIIKLNGQAIRVVKD